MSKSTSMLPTLAGGSGVLAHTLTDADLMKVVDATTLNADRDRKVTLGELKAYFTGTFADAENTTPVTIAQQPAPFTSIVSLTLEAGTWELSGLVLLGGATVTTNVGVFFGGPSGVARVQQLQPVVAVLSGSSINAVLPPCTVVVTGVGTVVHIYGSVTTSTTITAQGWMHARRLP